MRPKREPAANNRQTYMVTASTWERQGHFRNDGWAKLLIDTGYRYRGFGYLLHDRAEDYPYCSAYRGFELDAPPQGLKPLAMAAEAGAPEGAPFQIGTAVGAAEAAPFQSSAAATPEDAVAEGKTSDAKNFLTRQGVQFHEDQRRTTNH